MDDRKLKTSRFRCQHRVGLHTWVAGITLGACGGRKRAPGAQRVTLFIALGLLLSACSSGSNETGQPGTTGAPLPGYALGTVREIGQQCSGGIADSCRLLDVSCPDLPAIQVELHISEPAAGTPNRGTIIFSTGGGGTGFYYQPDLFQSLQSLGFRLVDRAWSNSWYDGAGGDGVRKSACRYATVATWIHDNIHTAGAAFCATGNSSGSGEISYAMVTYGREAIFDYVMPTSGPPMGRLDYACRGSSNAAWLAQCDALIPDPPEWQCTQTPTVDCTIPPTDAVCTALSPGATEQELLTDSVLAPDGVYQFPRTKMGFIEGKLDCGVGPVMGMLLHDAVQSSTSMQFVPDTPHEISSAQAGRDAMVLNLDADCVPQH